MTTPLSASRMAALLKCPRSHFWQYEIRLQQETDPLAFRFGTAWARALELRWKGAAYEDALAGALEEKTLEELDAATLAALLAGYYRHYSGQQEIVKLLYPEVSFQSTLPGTRKFVVNGRIDGLAVLQDDTPAILESKTTSDDLSPGSDYWLRLRFNSQLFQYAIAARQMGWAVDKAIYDVTRKPTIRPREIAKVDDQGRKIVLDATGTRIFKANGEPRESSDAAKGYFLQVRTETPEEFGQRLFEDTQARPEFYFARREVPILDDDLREFEAQRLTLARLILHCRQQERKTTKRESAWPRNVSERICPYCPYNSFCLQNITPDLNHPPAGFKITT